MKFKRLMLIIFIIILFYLTLNIVFGAQDDFTITGTLTDNDNNAVANSRYNFSFYLYDSYTGGTQLYELNTTLVTNNGTYNAVLNGSSTIKSSGRNIWLERFFNGQKSNVRINLTYIGNQSNGTVYNWTVLNELSTNNLRATQIFRAGIELLNLFAQITNVYSVSQSYNRTEIDANLSKRATHLDLINNISSNQNNFFNASNFFNSTYDPVYKTTFNSTYDQFAYNQSLYLWDKGLFNSTFNNTGDLRWLTTYNATYDLYAYNQSLYLWQNGIFNSTFNNTGNIIWATTFNSSYDIYAYNQSLYFWNNGIFNSTFNSTGDNRWLSSIWGYNETEYALRFLFNTTFNNTGNQLWVTLTNIENRGYFNATNFNATYDDRYINEGASYSTSQSYNKTETDLFINTKANHTDIINNISTRAKHEDIYSNISSNPNNFINRTASNSVLNSNLTILANLTVEGNSTINANLSVNNLTIKNLNCGANNVLTTTSYGTLICVADAGGSGVQNYNNIALTNQSNTFTDLQTFNSNLSIKGNVSIDGNLSVGQNLSVSSNLFALRIFRVGIELNNLYAQLSDVWNTIINNASQKPSHQAMYGNISSNPNNFYNASNPNPTFNNTYDIYIKGLNLTCVGTNSIVNGTYPNGTLSCGPDQTGGGSMDYTNLALVNITNDFQKNQSFRANVTIYGNLTVYNNFSATNITFSGFIFGNGSGLSNLLWGSLTSFPSACTVGQFVSAVGNTLTCGVVPTFNSSYATHTNLITNISNLNFVNTTNQNIVNRLNITVNFNVSTVNVTIGNGTTSIIVNLSGCIVMKSMTTEHAVCP